MTPPTVIEATDARAENCGAVRSSAWLGRIYVIEGEWWVVGAVSRTRMTLKLAESEMHAIRLQLRQSQHTLAAKLGISQPQLCKIEKGAVAAPEELMTRLRAMRPNDGTEGPAPANPRSRPEH